MPKEAIENPTVQPFLSAMESARRHGTLSTLDFSAVYPHIAGRATGGYVGVGAAEQTASVQPSGVSDNAILKQLTMAVDALNDRLKEPIDAKVELLGPNGFYEQDRKYQKSKNKRYIGQ